MNRKWLLVVVALGIAVAASAQMVERIYTFQGPHPEGHLVAYQDFGGYAWRTDTPERTEPNPGNLVHRIYVDYGERGEELFYHAGFWRTKYGAKKQVTPKRWFYIRLAPEVFNGSQWQYPWEATPLPPILSVPLAKPVAPDNAIKFLMQHFTVEELLDSMDKFDGLPDEGAPEE